MHEESIPEWLITLRRNQNRNSRKRLRNNKLKKMLDEQRKKDTTRKKKDNLQFTIHIEPLEHLPPPVMGARRVRNGDEQDARGGRKKKKGDG